jgi:signal transduction histidine kinase
MRGVRIPLDTTLVAETVRTGASRRMEEHELRALGRPQLAAFGPVMVLPLGGSGRVVGALVVARAPGAPPFTDSELAAATDFGARAGVALELVRVRREAERVLLYEDRSRIARDLHDRVIQQLFATGMQLQGVLGTLPPGRNAERIDAAIASLDDSITQIRRVIFTLESTARGQERASGRQLLFDLIERLSVDLSVEPTLRISGPIDAVLDGDLAEDVLAVVQEGLSNAVRHAAASDIGVEVQADRHGVSVTVTNDGLPLAPSGRRSGLGNLEERAARRSGSMVLDSEQGRTVLRWAVPLRRSRSHQ